jgi:3-methyladenine DNA glycosylase AlkD
LKQLVAHIERQLRESGNSERAVFHKAYLKSSLEFIGNNAKQVQAVTKQFAATFKDIERSQLDLLIDELWSTGIHELRCVAIGLITAFISLYNKRDLPKFRDWIIESSGWAFVDWLSLSAIGAIYSKDPSIESTLRKWSDHKDFWVRRTSMLALLRESKKGNQKAFELFSEFASKMVCEKEFFIRKAIGWVLREVSKKHPEMTFEFMSRFPTEMSGLTFREGSKYLPGDMKTKLIKKRATS